MALSLIVIPGMFGRKHDPNSSVKDKMLNIEAITEEMVRREEIRGIMSEEESEKSDTEGMQRMLEELESAK